MVYVKAMGDFIARGPTITVVFGCDTPSIPWDDVRRLCMGRTATPSHYNCATSTVASCNPPLPSLCTAANM